MYVSFLRACDCLWLAPLLFALLFLQQLELAFKSKQHSNDRINAEIQKQQQQLTAIEA